MNSNAKTWTTPKVGTKFTGPFSLFSLSGGLLVGLWPRVAAMDHANCAFGLLWGHIVGERAAHRPPWFHHNSTSTSPEREKWSDNGAGEGKRKSETLGGPGDGGPGVWGPSVSFSFSFTPFVFSLSFQVYIRHKQGCKYCREKQPKWSDARERSGPVFGTHPSQSVVSFFPLFCFFVFSVFFPLSFLNKGLAQTGLALTGLG